MDSGPDEGDMRSRQITQFADLQRVSGGPTCSVDGDDPVRYELNGRVAVITLNTPARRNAITPEISAILRDSVHHAETDSGVHALVVTGSGAAFCAGADRRALASATETTLQQMYAGFLAVADCVLPTIAAVNGPAVGAGLNLALACDIRVASPQASFDARFVTIGVHPGGGATWLLQRAVGPSLARAAVLFGLAFDAEDAVRHGLALAVAEDPLAYALELADAAASAPRDLILATKATMRCTASPGSIDSEQHSRAIAIETQPQVHSLERLSSSR